MKNILITGTNGMIGGLVLQYCLQREDVGRVTSITRKSTGIKHPKLLEVLHGNFEDFSPVEEHFKHQDICFFCIGVYTGQVNREQFRKITVDLTAAFALMLKKNSPGVSFCFLSGQGADSSENSGLMFAKDKGIAENILIRLGFPHLYIFRPGYVYPVTPRVEPNLTYRIFRVLYKPLVSWLFPQFSITSEQLAKAMVQAGFHGADRTIFENTNIKNLIR